MALTSGKRIAGMMSGLDIRYELGRDIRCWDVASPTSTLSQQAARGAFSFLHKAQPVLLKLEAPRAIDIGPSARPVQSVDATYAGKWEPPVLGKVGAPAAVLIRPDGYVAWAGDGTRQGLTEALTTWFGAPTIR